jgi:hypothetical protein
MPEDGDLVDAEDEMARREAIAHERVGDVDESDPGVRRARELDGDSDTDGPRGTDGP